MQVIKVMEKNRYVIIGSSAVAIGAINRLMRVEPGADITVISREKELPYNKCFLVDKLSKHKQQEQLYTKPANFFEKNGIKLLLGQKVTKIDRELSQVVLASGQAIGYSKLLLGMGSSPYKLNLPGCNADGVFYFHTMADLQNIENYIQEHGVKSAVVVGAGFTGLECADALNLLGLKVAVVERGSQLLPRHLDEGASSFIQNKMNYLGAELLLNSSVSLIENEQNKAKGVKLSCGKVVEAELVILATGVRPNIKLAEKAGLEIDSGYLKVNEYMHTSDPNIFAGGDLIQIKDLLTGNMVPSCMWQDAMLQGSYAGLNMADKAAFETKNKYSGALVIAQTHVFGLDVVACGSLEGGQVALNEGSYRKTNLPKGFLLVGDKVDFITLKRQLLAQNTL